MRATLFLPPSRVLIEAALTGLVAANRVLIQTGIVPPSPLDSRVRYKREASGLEEWNIASQCVKLGYGDCEDLNGWECARIQLEEDPDAHAIIVKTGPRTYHCVTELSSGEIVDVCPELGMRPHHSLSMSGLPWLEVAGSAITAAARAIYRKKKGKWPKKQGSGWRPKTTSEPTGWTPKKGTSLDPTTEPTDPTMPAMAASKPNLDNGVEMPEPMQTDDDLDEVLPNEALDEGGAAQ